MKSPKRMMECRNDTQKRSMLKKKQGQHLYSGSVLLCEIYHQTFYDPFIFCVSLRSALLLQSCFKWWESRKIMKCVTTWGSLWKMFVQKLWAAAAVVGPQKGEPLCLMVPANGSCSRSWFEIGSSPQRCWCLHLRSPAGSRAGHSPSDRHIAAVYISTAIKIQLLISRGRSSIVPFVKQRYFWYPNDSFYVVSTREFTVTLFGYF